MQVTADEARQLFGLTVRDVMHAARGVPQISSCGSYTLRFIPGASIQSGKAFDVSDYNPRTGF